jgi:hypothetical protein
LRSCAANFCRLWPRAIAPQEALGFSMCKTALAYDTRAGNGMPSAHDARDRLVQWTAGRDRNSCRLLRQTAKPRRNCGNEQWERTSTLEGQRAACEPSFAHPTRVSVPRAREGIKTLATISRDDRHRQAGIVAGFLCRRLPLQDHLCRQPQAGPQRRCRLCGLPRNATRPGHRAENCKYLRATELPPHYRPPVNRSKWSG